MTNMFGIQECDDVSCCQKQVAEGTEAHDLALGSSSKNRVSMPWNASSRRPTKPVTECELRSNTESFQLLWCWNMPEGPWNDTFKAADASLTSRTEQHGTVCIGRRCADVQIAHLDSSGLPCSMMLPMPPKAPMAKKQRHCQCQLRVLTAGF